MSEQKINRRHFIKNTGLTAAFMGLAVNHTLGLNFMKQDNTNSMPRYKGFNLLDFFSPLGNHGKKVNTTTEEYLKWMVGWGFDFVRIPMAYTRYLNADFSRNITPGDVYKVDERKLEQVDNLVYMAHKHGLHVSLNLHRAPGYCINAGFHEPYNLWKDAEAQEAFYFHWGMWAKRYKDVSSQLISFDLLNEPTMREDMNDQYSKHTPVPGGLYREIARKAAEVIRSANPGHFIIADGNNVGNDIVPEIEDLNIAQSCRGYFPHYISHHKAPWVFKDPSQAPEPVWPGTIHGQYFGREQLENYYKPWIELSKRGVGVHCGECGCWSKTPHKVFLAWFEDVLDILTKNGIGYALWNFRGNFGILDSGRIDVEYEEWHGHKLDGKLLGLLKKY